MSLKCLNLKTFVILAHALAVWQIHEGGKIMIYDAGGAMELPTRSHDAQALAIEIQKAAGMNDCVCEGHFIQ